MKQLCLSLLPAAAVPVLVAVSMPAAEIHFAPAEGQSVARKFTTHAQLSLGDLQMSMNGQPMPMEIKMEMDIDSTSEVEVTDQYVAMGAGQPQELRRTFDAIGQTGSFAMEMEMMPNGGQEMDITSSSELEGKSVTFEWNEESKEYEVAWHESEGDDELLEKLTEDMDLRVLLPAGSVAEGDTWEIDVTKLNTVLAPGGDMKLVPELDEEAQQFPGMQGGMGEGFGEMLGDSIEGTASGEFKGMQDLEGVNVAAIAIKLDIESSNDMTEQIKEQMSEMPEEMGEVDLDYADVELDIEAEGTLYWNVDAGHAHMLELSGSMTMIMDTAMKMSPGGQEMRIEQMFEMAGTFDTNLTVTAK